MHCHQLIMDRVTHADPVIWDMILGSAKGGDLALIRSVTVVRRSPIMLLPVSRWFTCECRRASGGRARCVLWYSECHCHSFTVASSLRASYACAIAQVKLLNMSDSRDVKHETFLATIWDKLHCYHHSKRTQSRGDSRHLRRQLPRQWWIGGALWGWE